MCSGTSEGQTVGRAGAGLVMGVLAAQQRSSVLPEEGKLLQRSFERRHKYHEFGRLPESKNCRRGFSSSPVVRGPGLIPDPGTKILQAMWHNQKNKIKEPLWTPVCSGFEAVKHLSMSKSIYIHICCCSVAKSYPTLCDPMDCSMPGIPVLYHLLKFAQTHVHGVGDAIQPSRRLPSPSPPALNLSQRQGLFR